MKVKILQKDFTENYQKPNFQELYCFKMKRCLSFSLILCLFYIGCYPADPNYSLKPLQNTEYTGFISRDFFQIVIETHPPIADGLSIEEEREHCKKEAISLRDQKTILYLKNVIIKSQKSEWSAFNIIPKNLEEENYKFTSDSNLNRGELNWFLDKMYLFMEDYSMSSKCKFIFRAIEKDLYNSVTKTKLIKDTQ